MCTLCENCIHCKVSKGLCRGVMDCDPDEIYCEFDKEEFYMDDDEIIKELKDDYIEKRIKEGVSPEQAEIDAEAEVFDKDIDVECSAYEEDSYYEDYYYNDGPYDTTKERDEAMGYYD